MTPYSHVTKTLEFSDLFDGHPLSNPVDYFKGINKRWLIESIVYMISVDRFDSFSMKAEHSLLVMFQDYTDRSEVNRLFGRLRTLERERQYHGVWLTLINHQALYRLLRRVLVMPNEQKGSGECYESYVSLLKATLVENSIEMDREREILGKIDENNPEIRDAMIFMQQDMLNQDQFGDNKKELEKAQMFKCLLLCKFGKQHKEVETVIKRIVNRYGFSNRYEYMLLANIPLALYHDKSHFGEGLIYICEDDFKRRGGMRLWLGFVSFISNKCLDVWDVEKMASVFTEKELLDNTCFRKYPVLKMSDAEYLIVSQAYYSHLFYDGFWWDVKTELSKSMSDNAVMDLLTREFSEKMLFNNVLTWMKGDRRIRLYNEYCFPSQQSAPDLALLTRHQLFMFEYKDMRVDRRVSDGNDMNTVMEFIDDRLNKTKGIHRGNKGLPQLISNMEDYFSGKTPWEGIYKKRSVKVYPIIVVHNRLFGVRGINYIMQEKMRHRIMESEVLREHVAEIGELLVVDMDMMILVSAKSNGSFSLFHQAAFGYQAHVKKGPGIYDRYDSFRNCVMNKWANEKSKKSDRKFKKGYKALVKRLV